MSDESRFDGVGVIRTKREGGALTPDQIRDLMRAYMSGEFAEEQMSALLMAIFWRGMTSAETAEWTGAMIASGERADLSGLSRPTVDKHSTGGVGDKLSLIIVPLVAVFGAAVPQMSGRGLGHTGGTLDKLESIPGWRPDLDPAALLQMLEKVGGVITAAGDEMAPADRRLYALRDVTGTVESIPLIASSIMSKKIAEGTGALVLVRDVTELRRRERELLTKDATIREIHHRVKNNLQTVAALLRLQARRSHAPEAREALEEAVRRVGSIAVVHETLSHAPEENVDFDDIADRVAMMAGEVSATETRVVPKIVGSFGMLPASVATPLAMVLTELLQNALQHGLSRGKAPGDALLEVYARRDPERLSVTVADNGAGLPPGFDPDATTSLGLQIVRTLVVGELGGRLRIAPRAGGGTEAAVDLPVQSELSP